MTVFESNLYIDKPADNIYHFLSDLNNHQQLMPESITNWSSTNNEASFIVQNMVKLSLKRGNCIENKEINIIPAEKPPFNLDLKWTFNAEEAGRTLVSLTITAELSMMMKMIASGPMQKLATFQTESLCKLLSD